MAITKKRTASGRINFGKIQDVAETPDLLLFSFNRFKIFSN